jgi:hypothetical protein
MKITKRTIDKAINFLETIPEEWFCRNVQTLNLSKNNVGRYHCSIGWLGVAPMSPFYDPSFLKEDIPETTFSSKYTPEALDNLMNDKIGEYLIEVNDGAPEGQIKATVINALCLLKEQL